MSTSYRKLVIEAHKLNAKIAREASAISRTTGVPFRDVVKAMKDDPGHIAAKLGVTPAFVMMWADQAVRTT